MQTTTSHFQKIPNFFNDEKECEKNEQYWNNPQTNPKFKNFKQTHFTAGDKSDFLKYRDMTNGNNIIDNISITENNIFRNIKLCDSVYWEKYKNLNTLSVENTFNYLFEKFKKCIFIKIKNGKLSVFLPFSNNDFENEWCDKIKIDPKYKNVVDFLQYISKTENKKFNPFYISKNIKKWCANNCLLRYEYPLNEKDTNIPTCCDMLQTLCNERKIPDLEFFINRRDFPLIKMDSTESYDHIYDSDKYPLISHKYEKYSPILSMVTTNNHSDIPIPTSDDWNRIYREEKFFLKSRCFEMKNNIQWKDKKQIAVFRGSSTGYGVDINTNMRLKLASMSKENKFLDAGITSWNLRPRKILGEKYLKTIDINSLNFSLVEPLTPNQQCEYKYIINVDGHVSAFRLSLELQSKSCILIVDSKYIFWYKKLLQPYIHYIPIKSDLSDLLEKIKWCIDNDEKCKEIANNAFLFYEKYLTKKGILDYLEKLLYEVKKHNGLYFYDKYHFSDCIYFLEKKYCKRLKYTILTTKKKINILIPDYKNTFNFLRCVRWIINMFDILHLKEIKNITDNVKKVSILNYELIKKTIKDEKLGYHEAFIMLCLNELIKDIPHFPYIFKVYDENNDINLLIENIQGISLLNYINGNCFNSENLFDILIQICFTLFISQNEYCFVHNDLTLKNVIIKFLKEPIILEYKIINKIYRIKTSIIAVIINMKKSQLIYKNFYFSLDNFIFSETLDILNFLKSLECEIKNDTIMLNFFENCKNNNLKTCLDFLKYFENKIIILENQTIFYDNYNSKQIFDFIFSETINQKIESFTNIFKTCLDFNFKFINDFQKKYCIECILRNVEDLFLKLQIFLQKEKIFQNFEYLYLECKNKLQDLINQKFYCFNINFEVPEIENNISKDIFYTKEKLKNIINQKKYPLLKNEDYTFLILYKNINYKKIIKHKIYNANINTLIYFNSFCVKN